MKANKFFAVALAALAFVGFTACNGQGGDTPSELTLNQTSLSLEVDQTFDLVANITVDSWTSSKENIATITPANDGKTAKVTAIAEGSAIITATAKGVTKTCAVAVKKAGGEQGGGATIEAAHIWPVVLDAVTAEANASIISGDFRVNDVDNFLYVWASGETYAANDNPTGKNYFGNNEGYLAMVVSAPAGWSGMGYCVGNADAITSMQALKEAIVANPDKYYLHLAMKATTPGNHIFYFFGSEATKLTIGSGHMPTADGDDPAPIYGDFTRDGAWHAFDIPLANYAQAIAAAEVKSGINILCILSGNQVGAQVNLDAIYFYEKK